MLAAPPAFAAPFNVEFNTPGELVSQFSLNAATGIPVKYSQVASGGLGNSGAVNILNAQDADHTTAVFNPAAFDFSQPGSSVTISQFVLRQNGQLTQTPFVMLGILSDVDERLDGGAAANSYASIRLMPANAPGTGTDVFLQTETKVNGGARLRTTPGITATLTPGNWYRVSATFTHASATDLLISAGMEDWGASGAAFQSSIFAFGPSSIGLAGLDQINGDASVYAGFRGFVEGGSDLYDNFSVVPEPASLTLLGLGMLAVARRARRN